MSEWDKVCSDWLSFVNLYYFNNTHLRQLYYDIKAEGDRLKRVEKLFLDTYGSTAEQYFLGLETKLEAIRTMAKDSSMPIHPQVLLEVLGE